MKDSTQRAAMMALLDEENTTLTKAAEAAGISRKSLYNALHDPKFLDEYKRQTELQTLERWEQLRATRQKAIDTLTLIMGDTREPTPCRLAAAKQLLAAEEAARDRLNTVLKSASFNADFF